MARQSPVAIVVATVTVGLLFALDPPIAHAGVVPTPLPRPDEQIAIRPPPPKLTVPVPIPRPPGIAGLASASDTAWRRTLSLAEQGAWTRALRVTGRAADPTLEALLSWISLRDKRRKASFEDLAGFLDRHPDWPERRRLVERAEQTMPRDFPINRQLAWFDRHPPITVTGQLRFLAALAETASTANLTEAVRETWRWIEMGRRDERTFLASYGDHLREVDHIERLDRMLWRGHSGAARRTMKLVPKGWQRLADARLRLRYRKAGVDAAVKRVPTELRDDPGLVFERLRWRRKSGLKISARELLFQAPPAERFTRLWWRERSWHIRDALDDGDFEDAYLLAAAHIQRSGGPFAEAEWLAGWIALQFLDRPADALRHFSRLHANVSTPISSARAAYWAGRAAEAIGEDSDTEEWSDVEEWYVRAARFQTTFYGQLAAARLGVERIDLPPAPTPDAAALAAFDDDDLVQATSALLRLRLGDMARDFLRHLARTSDDIERSALIANLAASHDEVGAVVFTARRAARARMILPRLGYPVRAGLPGQDERAGPEPALVHAIIRQESGFDTNAISPAGARGLMQLMPATARQTARSLGLRYQRQGLLSDPDYNIALGSAYLKWLVDRFDGHYVLAIAAYNAGPGRVVRWIRDHGDPRDGTVDVIDWIEQIPFSETRNYVQRVLEGLHIYRARLDDDPLQQVVIAGLGTDARKAWCVYGCGILMDQRRAGLDMPAGAILR